MELKVQSEKVIATAEKCPAAKEALSIMFPEAFKQTFKHGGMYQGNYTKKYYLYLKLSDGSNILYPLGDGGTRKFEDKRAIFWLEDLTYVGMSKDLFDMKEA